MRRSAYTYTFDTTRLLLSNSHILNRQAQVDPAPISYSSIMLQACESQHMMIYCRLGAMLCRLDL